MSKVKYWPVTTWYVNCDLIDDYGVTEVSVGKCDDGKEVLEFKETRCNGQEDTHVQGVLVRKGSRAKWKWDLDETDEYKDSVTCWPKGYAKRVREFFDENPPPKEMYDA